MISVACLVILFSMQKFGTSKVGLVVGPALFIWFCSLAGVGIYNIVKHDSSVLKAFNPVHIYYFFERNSIKAWYSLGGCLLCATGKAISLGILDSRMELFVSFKNVHKLDSTCNIAFLPFD